MAYEVASAATPFVQVIEHLAHDAPFVALMSGGIYPRLDLEVAKQMPQPANANGKPLCIVRELTDVEERVGGNHRITFTLDLHDLPAHGRKTIKLAAERAEWLFDGRLWLPATASLRIPMRSWWQSTQGPYPDGTYKTIKLISQFYCIAH